MKNISIFRKSDRGEETILLRFSIVGEVWFNDSLFLIIDPNIARLEYGDGTERLLRENAYYKVFGSINIDDKECLIVKPKDTLKDSVLSPQELLSERELQIVELVAQGQSNKQIAKKLKISEWTVSTHLRRVFTKLKVDSRAAMVYHCASLVRYRIEQTQKKVN